MIGRSLVEIFNDKFLAERMAFRGGTALHKLYLPPQAKYSEYIDLVQMKAESLGEVIDHIRGALSYLGKAKIEVGETMASTKYRFDSEIPPILKEIFVKTECLVTIGPQSQMDRTAPKQSSNGGEMLKGT